MFREVNGPFLLVLYVLPDWPFFWDRVLWMILFNAEAIFASSTSKSGIRIPLTEHEDFRSSTQSTKFTSLIHSIASVGNCEEVHTSVLNLIFQQTNVVGVENLSKWRSEICSRCWSVPQFFEESPLWEMTYFWLTVRTGISDPELVFGSHSSLHVMSEFVLIY